ncbi:MAG TPA: HEPN domain-containing protein [Thermoanaerobaculia bacterium]|nr:HEPN domain-containing protein [Thermoanaerobaculia bacterium]
MNDVPSFPSVCRPRCRAYAVPPLDKHYIPTRYPNGFERGAPTDYYTKAEAEAAIHDAGTIIEFCAGIVG